METEELPGLDPETRALVDVAKALEGLTAESVARVLGYFDTRYNLRPSVRQAPRSRERAAASTPGDAREATELPELFDAARAQTSPDKALVVAYFHQVTQNEEDFDSFAINKELKHLGHPSTNITRDFDGLISRRLAMQTRKEGKSRQARKRYKLTREGLKAVERMLSGEGTTEDGDRR